MVNKLRKMLRNEKGFTLVELLAVIVIMGIIAAIAVPSIAGIINNSKDDAHEANAIQMIETARLAHITGVEKDDVKSGTDNGYTLQTLITEDFLEEKPSNPEGGNYSLTNSYVEIDGTTYSVYLIKNGGGTAYVDKTLAELQN